MDEWLKNWIDELVDEYERLETEKLEKMQNYLSYLELEE